MRAAQVPARGEKRKLLDGRTVTVLDKVGGAYKVLNEAGKTEIVYLRQIMDPQNQ